MDKKSIINSDLDYWKGALKEAVAREYGDERIEFCKKQIEKYKFKLKNSDYFSVR